MIIVSTIVSVLVGYALGVYHMRRAYREAMKIAQTQRR